MVKLATAYTYPLPRAWRDKLVVLGAAAIFVLFAITQLFAFEKFPSVLNQLQLPGMGGNGLLQAALIVALEVFAVPALIAVPLSRLMRLVSTVLGWLVWIVWLFIASWAAVHAPGENVGIFGAEVTVAASWWVVVFIAVLAGVYAVALRIRSQRTTT